MERNTILAIVLSMVVLFAYQTIFVAPKQAQTVNSAQNSITPTLSATSNAPSAILPSNQPQPTGIIEKRISYESKTKESVISYTNVGGSLHKIDFIGNNEFPITDILSINGLENAQYKGQELSKNTVAYTYNDKNWQITKTFEIKDTNLINVRMEIKNVSEISILNNFTFTAFELDESRMEINQNNREVALYEYSTSLNGKIFRKGNATKFNDKNYRSESGKVNWIGFRDHYHAFVVKPDFETKAYEIKVDGDKQLNLSIKPQDKSLAPGESVTYNFSIYDGPQNPWLMKKYGQGFEKIVAFSNFPIIEWIGQAIYHIIPVFHSIFRSWGVSIILISLLIYGITYPLTMQSMLSMRKMQEVQPKIKALQEKYKGDPQKLNTEMVEIYRREKINPFGGCLPFLIQMPFFMALYSRPGILVDQGSFPTGSINNSSFFFAFFWQ